MITLRHVRLAALFGVLPLMLAFAGCGNVPRGVPPSEGILNFGRVNETFFRGAQPDEAGIANLSRLGVRTMINLRLRSGDPRYVLKGFEWELNIAVREARPADRSALSSV